MFVDEVFNAEPDLRQNVGRMQGGKSKYGAVCQERDPLIAVLKVETAQQSPSMYRTDTSCCSLNRKRHFQEHLAKTFGDTGKDTGAM